MVGGEFTLGGSSPADYDEAARASIRAVLATAANVSAEAVSLTLTAGSVVVTYEIKVTTAVDAEASRDALVAGPLATPAALETALTEQFEADGVVSAPTVEVQSLTAPVAEEAGEGDDGISSDVLIGVIVGGGVAAIAVVAIVVYCCCCKNKKAQEPTFAATSGVEIPEVKVDA